MKRRRVDSHESQDPVDLTSPRNYDNLSLSYQQPARSDRRMRVRVARKIPSTVSWEEAVETLENVDPALHAGLLADASKVRGHNWVTSTPSNKYAQGARKGEGDSSSKSASLPKFTQSPGTFRIVDASPDPEEGADAEDTSFANSSLLVASRPHAESPSLPSAALDTTTTVTTSEALIQNMIDPSYDFSDEDELAPRNPQQYGDSTTADDRAMAIDTDTPEIKQSASLAIKTENSGLVPVGAQDSNPVTTVPQATLQSSGLTVGVSYKQGDPVKPGVLYIPEPYWCNAEDGTRSFVHPKPFKIGNNPSISTSRSLAPTHGVADVAKTSDSGLHHSSPITSAGSKTPNLTPQPESRNTPYQVNDREILNSDAADEISNAGGSSALRPSRVGSERRQSEKGDRRSPVLDSDGVINTDMQVNERVPSLPVLKPTSILKTRTQVHDDAIMEDVSVPQSGAEQNQHALTSKYVDSLPQLDHHLVDSSLVLQTENPEADADVVLDADIKIEDLGFRIGG
jgi:hypothetical protein